MDHETVNNAIEQARRLVDGLDDPQMRAAAFGALVSKLLDSGGHARGTQGAVVPSPRPRHGRGASTASARILTLKQDGFFGEQRTLGEVKGELGARGWHYPLTALSGLMQSLVQGRELRRVQVKVGKRQVWKYSNY